MTTAGKNIAATREQLGATTREFFGIPVEHVDGTEVIAVDAMFARVVAEMRQHHFPAIVVLAFNQIMSELEACSGGRTAVGNVQ